MKVSSLVLWLKSAVGLRSHHGGQGLVEYGLIVASVGVVAVASVNALAGAQKAYLADLPTTEPIPSAPGALLHPTSVDTPNCTPSPITVAATSALTCLSPTVHDVFQNPYDRSAPQGWIGLHIDGAPDPVAVCHLSSPVGSQNSCPSLTWSPVNNVALIGTHSLTLWYECRPPATATCAASYPPESNHLAAGSGAVSEQFVPNLKFNASCVDPWENPPTVLWPMGQIEVGHNILCKVTVVDLNSGNPVPSGTPVEWSTVNGGPHAGIGLFMCDTGLFDNFQKKNVPPGYDIFVDSLHCPPPTITPSGTVPFVCQTDSSGTCSVVYRRMFDSAIQVESHPVLTLRALGATGTYAGLNIVPATQLHRTRVAAVCSSTDPRVVVSPVQNLQFDTDMSNPLHANRNPNNLVPATTQLQVTGTSATNLDCWASVYDLDTNPAADYAYTTAPSSNPEFGGAFPPLGVVVFKFNGVPLANCTLTWYNAPAPLNQAQGQAPFMSSCHPSTPLSMTGAGTGTLEVDYNGEPGPTPSHAPPDPTERVDIVVKFS